METGENWIAVNDLVRNAVVRGQYEMRGWGQVMRGARQRGAREITAGDSEFCETVAEPS